MPLSSAVLKKLQDAKATAGGNNILHGKYLLAVRSFELDTKFKGTMFIARFNVVSAEKTVEGVEPNKVGTDCSTAMNLDTNVSAAGNVKAIFLALLNKREEEIAGEDFALEVERYTAASQPGRGMVLFCETYEKIIRTGPNAGKPFVGHNWAHVNQSPAEVAARRHALEKVAVATNAAATPVPVDLEDLDMDTTYLVKGARAVFAGKSKSDFHFLCDGQRLRYVAADILGAVYAVG